MTPQRTYFLFKNDIRATIADTRRKMNVVHDGDTAKINAEVDHRLQTVWGMSLAEYNTLAS